MSNIDFTELFKNVKDGLRGIAETQFKDFLESAVNDGEKVIAELKEELQLWTSQLATGQLSADDFKYSVSSGIDLLKMVALKNAGLAQVQVDKFKTAVSSLITNTIIGLIP